MWREEPKVAEAMCLAFQEHSLGWEVVKSGGEATEM